MLPIKDKRVRAMVAAVLLAIIGYASYQGAVNYWTARQHNAAINALQRYEYDEAALYLKSCLYWRPRDPELLLLASQTARQRGSFDEAIAHLRLAEKHGAPRDSVDTERHLQHVQRGELSGVDKLMLFCRENPDGPASAMALEAIIEGSMVAKHEVLAGHAIDLWLKYRTGKLEQAQGLVWRGRSNLLFSKTVPLPQDDFRQAIELAPDNHQAHLYLAGALIDREPNLALPHLDWLKKHRPGDLNARFLVARYYRNIGQLEEAGRQFDELIEIAPHNKLPALIERAKVAMDLGRPDEAERLLLQAERLAPKHRDVSLAMAECMRRMNRFDEVDRHMQNVKDLDEKLAKMTEEWNKLQEAAKKKQTP